MRERLASSPEEPGPDLPSADLSGTNYMIRHWRGDLSLPVSYWVNGWLLGIAYIAGIFPITYRPSPSITYAIGLLIVIALGFVMRVWQLIGLWRSARKHTERGRRRIWAYLAQISVVFGWLDFAKGICQLIGLDPGK